MRHAVTGLLGDGTYAYAPPRAEGRSRERQTSADRCCGDRRVQRLELDAVPRWSSVGPATSPDRIATYRLATAPRSLWVGIAGGFLDGGAAIDGGIAYVGSSDGKLYVFDVKGCAAPSSGGTCAPLWTGATGGGIGSTPATAGGKVFVNSTDGKLYAFDGVTGCSGTPKTCAPVWTATSGGGLASPAVVDGVVYTGPFAFDATGATGCSGTPKVCSSLWIRDGGDRSGTPAVANGTVYVAVVNARQYAYNVRVVSPGALVRHRRSASRSS